MSIDVGCAHIVDYGERLGWNLKGTVKIIDEKEVIVFFSFFNRGFPTHCYLKVLFVYFKVDIFLSVLDLCFHLGCPPSLPVRPPSCKLKACPWSSGAGPSRGRRSRAGNVSVLQLLTLWGWARAPSPWRCDKKHLWWKGWLPILI